MLEQVVEIFLRQTCELIEQERSLNIVLQILAMLLAEESIQMQVRVGDVISNTDRRDPRPPAAVTAVTLTQRTNTVRCGLVVVTAHKNGLPTNTHESN